ncbi:MAG: hypothetical protein Q4C58_06450 [Eubacteriales bacterium]|nr:hypothetical protein [Eubacteriales bacterium]
MPVKEQQFWKEGIDEKRFALCIKNKIWMILAAALAGALFSGALYLIVRQATKGEPQYRAEVLFFIGYDIQEEDETLKEFINEYNAYTWGDMMKSDKVILHVMEALPDVERSVIEASVSTDIASDPEFLSAAFTTDSEELSNRIGAAYVTAMAAFGETMRGRGLTGIEAWKTTPAALVRPENRALYAAELGAVLGLLAGILGLLGYYVLDDSILLADDFEKRYPYPVFGYRTVRAERRWEASLSANLTYRAKTEAFREVELSDVCGENADFDALRETPVVLLVEWGTPCGRLLGHVIETLALQDVKLLGIIITGADNRFLRFYYGDLRSRRQDLQNGEKS